MPRAHGTPVRAPFGNCCLPIGGISPGRIPAIGFPAGPFISLWSPGCARARLGGVPLYLLQYSGENHERCLAALLSLAVLVFLHLPDLRYHAVVDHDFFTRSISPANLR